MCSVYTIFCRQQNYPWSNVKRVSAFQNTRARRSIEKRQKCKQRIIRGQGPDLCRIRDLRAVRHAAVAPRVGWAGGG